MKRFSDYGVMERRPFWLKCVHRVPQCVVVWRFYSFHIVFRFDISGVYEEVLGLWRYGAAALRRLNGTLSIGTRAFQVPPRCWCARGTPRCLCYLWRFLDRLQIRHPCDQPGCLRALAGVVGCPSPVRRWVRNQWATST